MMRAILIITALITVTKMAPTPTNMTTVIAAIEEATNINHYCEDTSTPRTQDAKQNLTKGTKGTNRPQTTTKNPRGRHWGGWLRPFFRSS